MSHENDSCESNSVLRLSLITCFICLCCVISVCLSISLFCRLRLHKREYRSRRAWKTFYEKDKPGVVTLLLTGVFVPLEGVFRIASRWLRTEGDNWLETTFYYLDTVTVLTLWGMLYILTTWKLSVSFHRSAFRVPRSTFVRLHTTGVLSVIFLIVFAVCNTLSHRVAHIVMIIVAFLAIVLIIGIFIFVSYAFNKRLISLVAVTEARINRKRLTLLANDAIFKASDGRRADLKLEPMEVGSKSPTPRRQISLNRSDAKVGAPVPVSDLRLPKSPVSEESLVYDPTMCGFVPETPFVKSHGTQQSINLTIDNMHVTSTSPPPARFHTHTSTKSDLNLMEDTPPPLFHSRIMAPPPMAGELMMAPPMADELKLKLTSAQNENEVKCEVIVKDETDCDEETDAEDITTAIGRDEVNEKEKESEVRAIVVWSSADPKIRRKWQPRMKQKDSSECSGTHTVSSGLLLTAAMDTTATGSSREEPSSKSTPRNSGTMTLGSAPKPMTLKSQSSGVLQTMTDFRDRIRQQTVSNFDENVRSFLVIAAKQSVVSVWIVVSLLLALLTLVTFVVADCMETVAVAGHFVGSCSMLTIAVSAYFTHGKTKEEYKSCCKYCDVWCRRGAALIAEIRIVEIKKEKELIEMQLQADD